MSDMAPTNGDGALPGLQPGGIVPEDASVGVDALLRAVRVMAQKAAMDPSAQEAKDYGAACLSFAQAIVVLDPDLNQQGVPLAHEVALEQQRQDGLARLEQVRQAAGAPTPKNRKLVRKDHEGKVTSTYEEQ